MKTYINRNPKQYKINKYPPRQLHVVAQGVKTLCYAPNTKKKTDLNLNIPP